MTILFHATELSAFAPTGVETSVNSGSPISHRTDANEFSASFSRASIGIDGGSVVRSETYAPQDNIWFHAVADPTTTAQVDSFMFGFFDQNGSLCAGIDTNNGAPFISVRPSVGGSFGQVGNTIPALTSNALVTIDINIDFRGTQPRIDLYTNGILAESVFTDLFGSASASTGVTGFDLRDPGASSNEIEYSEIIFANQPTLGMRVRTLPIVGNGDFANFSGDVNDVAGLQPNQPGLTSAVAGEEHSFLLEDLGPEAALLNPISVAYHVEFQPSTDPTEPQNLASGLRIGTQNFAFLLPSANAGLNQGSIIFDFNNPATGLPWTLADINGLQGYNRSEP